MRSSTLTVREARRILFQIDTEESDTLRRKLFELFGQDVPLNEARHQEFINIKGVQEIINPSEQ